MAYGLMNRAKSEGKQSSVRDLRVLLQDPFNRGDGQPDRARKWPSPALSGLRRLRGQGMASAGVQRRVPLAPDLTPGVERGRVRSTPPPTKLNGRLPS